MLFYGLLLDYYQLVDQFITTNLKLKIFGCFFTHLLINSR